MGQLYRLKREFQKKWETYLRTMAKPNKDALWIFGVQKAGTSAIAGLLAHRADKTVTIDTKMLWDPYYSQLKSDHLSLAKHIKKNPFDFSKDIIKEPTASILIDKIDACFKMNQFVFIYRNPHDVIRSILNRLKLPGNQQDINIEAVHENWRIHFNNGANYIDSLIDLWISVYAQSNYIDDKRCIFVKYENFLKDKEIFIDTLCDKLNFKKVQDTTHLLDYNFQPKGNPEVNLINFFGQHNYDLIEEKTKRYQR